MSSNTLDLTKLGISRPEKMRWMFHYTNNDPLQNCLSKSIKKFLSKSEEIREKHSLSLEFGQLSFEEYSDWLGFYRQQMEELGYDLFADETWYKTKVEQGFEVEKIFIKQNGQLVGTAVLTRKNSDFITINFKASVRLEELRGRASIGSLLDYYFVKNALERSISQISAGVARNAAGVSNTISYLEYKLRFGYTPEFSDEFLISNQVECNDDGWVLFYGYTKSWQEDPMLYSLKHKSSTSLPDTTFLANLPITFKEITI